MDNLYVFISMEIKLRLHSEGSGKYVDCDVLKAAVSSFLRFLNAFFEQIKISSYKLMFLKACANADPERLGSGQEN